VATIIGSGLESYLHQQAREHALNRIAEAKEEAERIAAQAEEETATLKRSSEERTARTIDERRRRVLAQARLKAKQTIVRRQEELLSRVWSEAATKLQAPIEPAKRLSLLKRLIIDAAEQLDGGALEVQVNAVDHQFFAPDVLADMRDTLDKAYGVVSLEVLDEPIAAWGGAVVTHRDAHQLVNNTLDERLALTRRYLRDQVYRLLTNVSQDADKRRVVAETSS
jgi:vacuolar-type H+-ATPase subunit E/Vma4